MTKDEAQDVPIDVKRLKKLMEAAGSGDDIPMTEIVYSLVMEDPEIRRMLSASAVSRMQAVAVNRFLPRPGEKAKDDSKTLFDETIASVVHAPTVAVPVAPAPVAPSTSFEKPHHRTAVSWEIMYCLKTEGFATVETVTSEVNKQRGSEFDCKQIKESLDSLAKPPSEKNPHSGVVERKNKPGSQDGIYSLTSRGHAEVNARPRPAAKKMRKLKISHGSLEEEMIKAAPLMGDFNLEKMRGEMTVRGRSEDPRKIDSCLLRLYGHGIFKKKSHNCYCINPATPVLSAGLFRNQLT